MTMLEISRRSSFLQNENQTNVLLQKLLQVPRGLHEAGPYTVGIKIQIHRAQRGLVF